MEITRYSNENITRVYRINIDEDRLNVIKDDWRKLRERSKENYEDAPEIDIIMLIEVAMNDYIYYREDKRLSYYVYDYGAPLHEWIRMELDDYIWGTENEYIADGEVYGYEDEVELTEFERVLYEDFTREDGEQIDMFEGENHNG